MKTLLLPLLMLSSAAFSREVIKEDPYAKKLSSKIDYVIPLRIMNHGVKEAQEWIDEQIHAAEVIYAQCGVRVKLEVREQIELSLSREQDNLLLFEGTNMVFSPEARTFFERVYPGKRDDTMDVHIVDHLNHEIRETQSTVNQSVDLGISFNPVIFGWIWHGLPAELAGQHVFVAADTARLDRREFIRIKKKRGFPRHLSLLAHEIGHQVFEGQRTRAPRYYDHWCDGIQDYCPNQNLMAGGGNPDQIWKHNTRDEVVGFDEMPKLNKRQCELMLKHPLTQKL